MKMHSLTSLTLLYKSRDMPIKMSHSASLSVITNHYQYTPHHGARRLRAGAARSDLVVSSSGRQPNFVALNRGRHLCSAGRPSGWALAHILVSLVLLTRNLCVNSLRTTL